jgi:hypothetical protein
VLCDIIRCRGVRYFDLVRSDDGTISSRLATLVAFCVSSKKVIALELGVNEEIKGPTQQLNNITQTTEHRTESSFDQT